MSLKNYYAILGISVTANLNEIKAAYKAEAITWHPDKNPNRNTTYQMQEINEAYLVLTSDKKSLYDKEHLKYYGDAEPAPIFTKTNRRTEANDHSAFDTEAAKFREQAAAYTKKSLSEILSLLEVGGKAFKESLVQSLFGYGLLIIIVNLIFWMCNK